VGRVLFADLRDPLGCLRWAGRLINARKASVKGLCSLLTGSVGIVSVQMHFADELTPGEHYSNPLGSSGIAPPRGGFIWCLATHALNPLKISS